ncbi:NLI interacting factor-like phosphatase [Medicago truncatula]|uniref:Mitochondrial import inner membrane translocase subunit TIM50 n=1 Tax=Medicago truncatula TaxID=3880 RepID=A0A072U4P8_MEDTR|nr:NLI interacting factor-like phosphatase [Medicago truncatula]
MEISKSKTLEADHDDHKSSEEPEFGLSLEKLNLGPKKKLLIMNLNGFLLHRAHVCDKKAIPKSRTADYKYPYFLLFKRPFSEEFIKFCLERFEVGLWSSAMEHNIDDALACAIGELKNKLLFVWDQDKCRDSGFKSLENNQKPLFFKELKEVWHSVKKGGPYSASNTLLIDDKPYKSLLNPVVHLFLLILFFKSILTALITSNCSPIHQFLPSRMIQWTSVTRHWIQMVTFAST